MQTEDWHGRGWVSSCWNWKANWRHRVLWHFRLWREVLWGLWERVRNVLDSELWHWLYLPEYKVRIFTILSSEELGGGTLPCMFCVGIFLKMEIVKGVMCRVIWYSGRYGSYWKLIFNSFVKLLLYYLISKTGVYRICWLNVLPHTCVLNMSEWQF